MMTFLQAAEAVATSEETRMGLVDAVYQRRLADVAAAGAGRA